MGKEILVVDDTEANIDILVDILDEEYEVAVALDGEGALEYLEDEVPDCILLDVMMPGMDGFEVCKRIKADDRVKHVPVVFITAMTEESEIQKGLSLGASGYIKKPIDPEEVLAKVKELIS
jgi:putative two-component system response regulator